ncbi:retrovirus-related pol polyprotein from transposon RE1 [Tanacetum coccineum]
MAKAATIRVLIAIATAKGWPLHQLDVNNVFLHGFVDEEIYVKPLEGYTKAKPGRFVKAQGEQFTMVLVYVDDILLSGNSMQVITDTKKALDQKCAIKDFGLARASLQAAMHLLRYLKGSINKGLFNPVQSNLKVPITLFCDNKAAQKIATNPCYHERTKHLDIDSHFTWDKVQEGFLQTAYIPTSLQLADIMTKALGGS